MEGGDGGVFWVGEEWESGLVKEERMRTGVGTEAGAGGDKEAE